MIAENEILSKKGEDAFYVPGDVGITLGTSYDWRVPTPPQEAVDG